ncbi:MAG: ribosome recycling factor [Acidobacteriota bacterium]
MTKPVIEETRKRMEKTIADLSGELASVRTGRASVHLLDNIVVEYYGTQTPLNQLATLHVPEPTMITIQPWDVSASQAIEKALRTSDLGINPSSDGKVIRVPVPPLTQERRQMLAKHVHKVAEEHRTAIRQIRRDGNEKLKKQLKEKQISEDMEKEALEEVQKLTDKYIGSIDQLSKTKEAEIVEI